MTAPRRRLITRSDLDGLLSAALLKAAGEIEDIVFAHPKDVQDGTVDISPDDILTCLPPHPAAGRVYTHRTSADDGKLTPSQIVCNPDAQSVSEVVYRHFGGADVFGFLSPDLLAATRAMNTATLSKQDILSPAGWTLLGYLADSRTGLGRYRRFRISNYQLMLALVDILQKARDVQDVLSHPDVAERVELYREHAQPARAQLVRVARVNGPLVTFDFREEQEIYVTNRFTCYALYPQCSLSLHILPGRQNRNTVFALGHSILNKTATVDAGRLMSLYGGGGHPGMGACQVDHAEAARVKAELIALLHPQATPATAIGS